jgi:hypothetical protein
MPSFFLKLSLVVSIGCFAQISEAAIMQEQARARVPAGAVRVRTIDSIDSKKAKVGQTFDASLDEPLLIDGKEIPKGSTAKLQLVEAKSAGKLGGKAQLSIALVSVEAGGVLYEAESESVTSESAGKGKSSAIKIGAGAGIGAAVGGIFGGGRGAAIGAGGGAAAGTALAMLTGPEVKIASETKLTFQVK